MHEFFLLLLLLPFLSHRHRIFIRYILVASFRFFVCRATTTTDENYSYIYLSCVCFFFFWFCYFSFILNDRTKPTKFYYTSALKNLVSVLVFGAQCSFFFFSFFLVHLFGSSQAINPALAGIQIISCFDSQNWAVFFVVEMVAC